MAIQQEIRNTANGRWIKATLLGGMEATDDGEWIEWFGFTHGTIQVEGIVTASVGLRVSNRPTQPLNSYHGGEYLTAKSADGEWVILDPFRWIKVMVTSYTDGTINAYLVGRE